MIGPCRIDCTVATGEQEGNLGVRGSAREVGPYPMLTPEGGSHLR
jgi:hypothetical protein